MKGQEKPAHKRAVTTHLQKRKIATKSKKVKLQSKVKKINKKRTLGAAFSTTPDVPDQVNDVAQSVMQRLRDLSPSEIKKGRDASKALNLTERNKHDEFFNTIGTGKSLHDNLPPIDPKTGLFYDATRDKKSSKYIPGPNINDDGNAYSLATRGDNEQYTKQMTILNTFQEKMGELDKFLPPFFKRNKPGKDMTPSTRGEMNAMLHNAIVQNGDFELGWDRFSKMIHSQPDYLKSWLELSLFDQFQKPLLLRRDADVQTDNVKTLYGPDRASYELMLMGCMQAFTTLKKHFKPEYVEMAELVLREGSESTNAGNDDDLNSPATMMYRALEEVNAELKRRKELPREEQERLLALDLEAAQNGGVIIHDDVNAANLGLKRAVHCLLDRTEDGKSNKLQQTKEGIPQFVLDKQIAEKNNALGLGSKTVVDITDNPTIVDPNPITTIQYKAGRKIAADDSDDDATSSEDGTTTPNDTITPDLTASKRKIKPVKPLITHRITTSGTIRYKINLPSLPFSIEDGGELEGWMDRLEELSTSSIYHAETIAKTRAEMLADPFAEPYHCLQQLSTWRGRLHFILRDVLEHYYAALWKRNPQLYRAIRGVDAPPENYCGLDPLNDSMGFDLEMLETMITAAKEHELFHIWLEATTLHQKLSPAPTKIPTLRERRVMIRENFLKNMILNDLITNIPIGAEGIGRLVPQIYFKAMGLFADYAERSQQIDKDIKKFDTAFVSNYNIERKHTFFMDNLPRKITRGEEQQYLEMKAKQAEFEAALNAGEDLSRFTEGEMNVDFISNYKLIKECKTPEEVFQHFIRSKCNGNENDPKAQEFIGKYHKARPQRSAELDAMEGLIRENIRRYPLLACMVPPSCEGLHKPLNQIIEERYTAVDERSGEQHLTLPPQLRNLAQKAKKNPHELLPLTPQSIDVREYGFDTLQKVNAFPYPPQVQQEIDNLKVSMVKMPITNLLLVSPDDMTMNSNSGNYRALMVTPATSIMKIDDAIDWINEFTQMGQFLRIRNNQAGLIEECEEYNYQLQHAARLQEEYGIDIPFFEITDSSVNYRNMARIGLFCLDTIIISWAQQNELRLPTRFTEAVIDSYQELTNDHLFKDINNRVAEFEEEKAKQEEEAKARGESTVNLQNPIKITKILPPKQKKDDDNKRANKKIEIDSKSLTEDLKIVNPPLSRVEQWRKKSQTDQLTNAGKFFQLSVDERVDLIESTHERERAENSLAKFFNDIDPNIDINEQTQDKKKRYHLLRAYLRFAMRAGDDNSMQKALILYRSATKLLQYVQRRSNEDVYMDTAKHFGKVTNEEEFHKATEKLEQRRQTIDSLNKHIPPATRMDMTRDDIEKSTKNLGPISQLWDQWYGSGGMKPAKNSVQYDLSQDPRAVGEQPDVAEPEVDELLTGSGILDDYTDRIDALLDSNGGRRFNTTTKKQNNNDPDSDGAEELTDEVSKQRMEMYKKDQEEIELYTSVLKRRKNKKLGELFVPGFDMSDAEEGDDQQLVKDHIGDGYEAEDNNDKGNNHRGDAIASAVKNSVDNDTMSMEMGKGGGLTGTDEKSKAQAEKYAPHTRLKRLATASHLPFDYMTTQMVINFHQFLIRNHKSYYRLGLSSDVDSKRFSDEVSAQWALTRRNLYDQRIKTLSQFDVQIESPDITPGDKRILQREKTKMAVGMLRKNRPETELQEFERRAAQLAIMTVDTLLLEGYLPVAKIVAKQAFDDGVLSKEFISEMFDNNGPDLDDDESAIMDKELGLDQMKNRDD